MYRSSSLRILLKVWVAALVALTAAACSSLPLAPPAAPQASAEESGGYRIGPGDELQIFVWRNPELSTVVRVRPDGRISIPLIEDMPSAGKAPTVLARDIEGKLREYVKDPIVTVIVADFVGPFDQQVRVVGEAAQPQAIPYRSDMTVLDVLIESGGMTEFAAGNRAVVLRRAEGKRQAYRVRLDDLLKDGDVSANVEMLPGDILIIPQSWF